MDTCDVAADGIATAASLVADVRPGRPLSQVRALVREPLSWYLSHVHWPSYLTDYGPTELSVVVGRPGDAALRYVTDIADHRQGLAGNWDRYLSLAGTITHAPVDQVSTLLARHLDASPPATRSPLYHGVGLGRGGFRRGTLYFVFGGLAPESFAARFREELPALEASFASAGGRRPQQYHSVSYDFDPRGSRYRAKFYAWLDRHEPLGRFRDRLGAHPDVEIADTILDELRQTSSVQPERLGAMVQSSIPAPGQTYRHKVIFNCSAWGLNGPEAFARFVQWIEERWQLDCSGLYATLRIFAACEIPLMPTWIAVSGSPQPTFSVYLVPLLDAALLGDDANQDSVGEMLMRARAYLFASRRADGSWSEGAGFAADYALTTRTVAALAHPQTHDDLRSSGQWLAEHARDPGAPAFESPLAWLAISRVTALEPPSAAFAIHESDSTEQVAWRMLLAAHVGNDSAYDRGLAWLVARERWTGGWSGRADDLVVNAWIADALAARVDPTTAPLLKRTGYCFSEHPVSANPARIGSWMRGWLRTGHDPYRPSPRRALALLADRQQRDGRWLGAPYETASGDGVYMDPNGLVTTASAVEALACLPAVTTGVGVAAGAGRA